TDVVRLLHCLEHIPNAVEVLERTRSLLEPNGHLYVEVPNFGSLPRLTLGEGWQGWQPGEHVYLFDKASLTAALRSAGYEPAHVGTLAPVYDGLAPSSYAYFLGLSPALRRAVRLKARLRGSGQRTAREGSP